MTDPEPPSPVVDDAAGAPPRRGLLAAGALVAVLGVVAVTVGLARSHDRTAAPTPTTGSSTPSSATPEAVPTGATARWAPEVRGRRRLVGFGETPATVTGADGRTCQVCLLLADTPERQERGLMEVRDPALGGYDGMVFRYDRPVDGGFWMRRTRLPLTIVFFDRQGRFVSSRAMVPCPDGTADADCPRYPAAAPFTYAVELAGTSPADVLLVDGSTLTLDGGPCPEVLRRAAPAGPGG